jgi:hypothetical protein
LGRSGMAVGWVGGIAMLDWQNFFCGENRQHEQLSIHV